MPCTRSVLEDHTIPWYVYLYRTCCFCFLARCDFPQVLFLASLFLFFHSRRIGACVVIIDYINIIRRRVDVTTTTTTTISLSASSSNPTPARQLKTGQPHARSAWLQQDIPHTAKQTYSKSVAVSFPRRTSRSFGPASPTHRDR